MKNEVYELGLEWKWYKYRDDACEKISNRVV